MALTAIWAQSRDGVIGDGEGLIWHLPEDMAHFKELTMGHPVIMGRSTWESIPEKFRPLPGRKNIILSSRKPDTWSDGAEVTDRITVDDGFIIGGGSVYASTLSRVEAVEMTVIDCLLKPALGPRAVVAPLIIEEEFKLVTTTEWLTSPTGTVQGTKTDEQGVRYMFRRYERP